MCENEKFLQINIIWKDVHMLELEFTVSNNGYRGKAQRYDTRESLVALAEQLEGFPKGKMSVVYEIQGGSDREQLSIGFRPTTSSGLVGAFVVMTSEGSADSQYSKLSLELVVEPNSIDVFQKQLATLAAKEEGCAILIAR